MLLSLLAAGMRARGRAVRGATKIGQSSRDSFFRLSIARAAPELDAEIEDVIGLIVDHRIRHGFRNLRAQASRRLRVGIAHRCSGSERREVARTVRGRGWTAADACDPLPFSPTAAACDA